VCFCDLRFFNFFLGEACSRERVGEMGKVELVGLVEVVVFWGGGGGLLRGLGVGCGMWDGTG